MVKMVKRLYNIDGTLTITFCYPATQLPILGTNNCYNSGGLYLFI